MPSFTRSAFKKTSVSVWCGSLCLTALLAGCYTSGGETASSQGVQAEGSGSVLKNLFLYGGTTVPPVAPDLKEEIDCPQVDITENGAAVRIGEGGSTRYQLTIGETARDCTSKPDGSLVINVGIEGRALLGQAGHPGRFEAPIHILIKRGETVVAQRVQRVVANVPAGSSQGTFTVIERGIVVPNGRGDLFIEAGFGAGIAKGRR